MNFLENDKIYVSSEIQWKIPQKYVKYVIKENFLQSEINKKGEKEISIILYNIEIYIFQEIFFRWLKVITQNLWVIWGIAFGGAYPST